MILEKKHSQTTSINLFYQLRFTSLLNLQNTFISVWYKLQYDTHITTAINDQQRSYVTYQYQSS